MRKSRKRVSRKRVSRKRVSSKRVSRKRVSRKRKSSSRKRVPLERRRVSRYMAGSELPYLPADIKRHIISFVDDVDIRRHFGVYSRIPRDDMRFGVLLKKPLIRQIHGKYHPTSGAHGPPYGEVVIPQHVRLQHFWGAESFEEYLRANPVPLGVMVEYSSRPPEGDLHITVMPKPSGMVVWEDYTDDDNVNGAQLVSRFYL